MKAVLYGTLFLFMTSSVAIAQDNEIFACMNRSGKLTVIGDPDSKREECRRREALRSWNQQGPEGPQGPQGPAGPAGTPGAQLHLFDGAGQDLGIYMGQYYENLWNYWAFNEVLGIPIRFEQVSDSQSSRLRAEGLWLFYGLQNCQGQPFIDLQDRNIDLHALIVPTGSVAGPYYKIQDFQAATRVRLSRSNGSGCTNLSAYNVQATVLLEEVTLPFSVPLTWPLLAGVAP